VPASVCGEGKILQKLGDSGGKSNQGCTSVQNDTSVVHLSSLLAKGDGIEINLPVGLAPQRNLGQLARVVALIDTTKGSLRLLVLVGVAQVEGENRLVKKALVKHVVEGGDNAVDTDGVIAKTHDAVEPAESKGETWLRGSLGKVLVLHLQVADLENIVGDETAERARSVTDLEVRAVLLVCRRRRRVVLGVKVAGDRAALSRWDPEVGAACVEDNLERLRRCTEGDLGEV
jgi:hypothetical protein